MRKKTVMTQCAHKYEIAKQNYYKYKDAHPGRDKPYDTDVEYTTLFCVHCGKTKEIISADHRRKK